MGQDAYEGEDGKLQEGRGLGVYRCLKAHSRLEFSILDLDNVYFTRRVVDHLLHVDCGTKILDAVPVQPPFVVCFQPPRGGRRYHFL